MMKHLKLLFLYFLAFIFSVAPVLTYFFMNMDRYISTTQDKIKLGFGGILLVGILILKLLDKLKAPSHLALFGMIFILSYLLSAVLQDLMIFSFLALLGELFDGIVMIYIRRMKRKNLISENAEKTAKQIEEIIKKQGIGRV